MAVAIASSSRTAGTSNSTSIIITKPTGLTAGDILFAYIYTNNGGGSAPAGWSTIGTTADGDASGFALQLNTFAKIADSSDVAASDFTFTIASDTRRLGYLFRITGDFSSGTITDYITSDTDDNITVSGSTFTFPGGVTPYGNNSLLMIGTVGGKTTYNGTDPYSSWAVANSNPSWTTQYNEGMPAGSADSILASVVSSTYTSAIATGSYSVNSTAVGNEVGGKLISISETTNVTISPNVITMTSSAQSPTVTGGANVSPAVVTMTASVQDPTVATAPAKWVNQDKSAQGTITNQDKTV